MRELVRLLKKKRSAALRFIPRHCDVFHVRLILQDLRASHFIVIQRPAATGFFQRDVEARAPREIKRFALNRISEYGRKT